LAVLGGADRVVLEKARSTKPGFVGLGLVMLATAAVASLSMGFALTGPLKAPVALAIPLSLCWGAIILVINRYLVKSMQGVREKRTILAMAVPRLIMAAVIGVVVATPITLRIFEPEILAQLDFERHEQQANVRQELVKVIEEITVLEKVKSGQGEPPTTPALTSALDALGAAQSERDALRERADDVYLKRACELAGAARHPQCRGLSSVEAGQGPRWRALNAEYKRLSWQLDATNRKVVEAQEKVIQARSDAAEAARSTMDQQVKDAQKRLCGSELMTTCDDGLMKRKAELEEQIRKDSTTSMVQVRQDVGLIAQLNALHAISSVGGNVTELLAHTAVMLFFFMTQIMPVTVKTLVALGNDHQYDDVVDRMKKAES
jgi:hypothetical protein